MLQYMMGEDTGTATFLPHNDVRQNKAVLQLTTVGKKGTAILHKYLTLYSLFDRRHRKDPREKRLRMSPVHKKKTATKTRTEAKTREVTAAGELLLSPCWPLAILA